MSIKTFAGTVDYSYFQKICQIFTFSTFHCRYLSERVSL